MLFGLFYLSDIASFHTTVSLLEVPERPCKGLVVSLATILRLIRQAIVQAYAIKHLAPPFPFTAHSTREVCMYCVYGVV